LVVEVTSQNNFMDSIIITSPSLDSEKNIGGISVLTKLTSLYNTEKKYIHFFTGRKDGDPKSLIWIIKQFFVPLKYIYVLLSNYRRVKICHINIPQDNKGICREGLIVCLSKLFKKKIIVHLRGGEYNMKNIPNIVTKCIFKKSLMVADAVICLGNNEKVFLTEKYSLDDKKIYVLENAVEIKEDISNKFFSGVLTLIFLGRIDKDKGLDEIINALKDINENFEIRFILCGTGPYEKFVVSELSKILGDKFEFHGVVTGSIKERLLSESHIFLLPSYFEGLPNALLEAMSFGLVPICTSVGSIPNVISNGINGYIIPLKDSTSISDKIQQLEKDRLKLKEIGIKAHKLMLENFSIKSYIVKLNQIYNNI
jgi:glycosyltransferase involved in cell wall biosynthesis